MTDRLIRLMKIITLVQARPGILARELAERCGTSERTIYRDMDALSSMHIPIMHMGRGKGYTFIGHFAMYPIGLTEEEAQALFKSLPLLDELKPRLPEAFETAYEKVLAAVYKQSTEKMEIYGERDEEPDADQ
ncbi:HTH domain-containing protein [Paenibacillus sp. F411]|uniref:Helix-turn-helix type 11 domain protein n=1 Tax=Paenibacillus algicola TaxID=2565926 RepID=A0A4P8XHQ5_9BACL|nr:MULTISPECIES: HTH domain-containing protein [Paenibacillus]MBO2944005.1 HTH domain-containing protein [Paenibacillus sp. F411]QCT01895.1 helix-turn-helix type 11 domain protein [Paenibacillus algicola]